MTKTANKLVNFKSITTKSVVAKLATLGLIAGLIGASTMVSVSKDAMPTAVNNWYAALRSSDAEKFQMVMSDEATVELKFLGITQTKQEYIASLEEWKNANKDATITTRLVEPNAGQSVVEACYRFPSNEVFARETFTITNEKIAKSVQEQISKVCPKL